VHAVSKRRQADPPPRASTLSQAKSDTPDSKIPKKVGVHTDKIPKKAPSAIPKKSPSALDKIPKKSPAALDKMPKKNTAEKIPKKPSTAGGKVPKKAGAIPKKPAKEAPPKKDKKEKNERQRKPPETFKVTFVFLPHKHPDLYQMCHPSLREILSLFPRSLSGRACVWQASGRRGVPTRTRQKAEAQRRKREESKEPPQEGRAPPPVQGGPQVRDQDKPGQEPIREKARERLGSVDGSVGRGREGLRRLNLN